MHHILHRPYNAHVVFKEHFQISYWANAQWHHKYYCILIGTFNVKNDFHFLYINIMLAYICWYVVGSFFVSLIRWYIYIYICTVSMTFSCKDKYIQRILCHQIMNCIHMRWWFKWNIVIKLRHELTRTGLTITCSTCGSPA